MMYWKYNAVNNKAPAIADSSNQGQALKGKRETAANI
jgi:hypothetical protein